MENENVFPGNFQFSSYDYWAHVSILFNERTKPKRIMEIFVSFRLTTRTIDTIPTTTDKKRLGNVVKVDMHKFRHNICCWCIVTGECFLTLS